MPEYNIMIGNRAYKVELIKKKGKRLFNAKVNDKPVELTLEESTPGTVSPLTLNIAEKTYQVDLARIDRHAPFTLKVNNTLFKAELREPTRRVAKLAPPCQPVRAAETERHRGAITEQGTVVAPMAGKIVAIKVKKDDVVKVGDVVCILEAMKMENDIRATKAGKILEVNVTRGTPVNDGDVLITIE